MRKELEQAIDSAAFRWLVHAVDSAVWHFTDGAACWQTDWTQYRSSVADMGSLPVPSMPALHSKAKGHDRHHCFRPEELPLLWDIESEGWRQQVVSLSPISSVSTLQIETHMVL